jgi:hypothetical protein
MNTLSLSPHRFVAALSVSVVVAVSAWVFVSSIASNERDPFHFASIKAANAKLSMALLPNRTASACPNVPEPWDPVCVRG